MQVEATEAAGGWGAARMLKLRVVPNLMKRACAGRGPRAVWARVRGVGECAGRSPRVPSPAIQRDSIIIIITSHAADLVKPAERLEVGRHALERRIGQALAERPALCELGDLPSRAPLDLVCCVLGRTRSTSTTALPSEAGGSIVALAGGTTRRREGRGSGHTP